MVVLYFAVSFLAGSIVTLISKYASSFMPTKKAVGNSVYIIINAAWAMLFFFVGNRFVINVNTVTVMYSAVYAVVCALSIVSRIYLYRYMSIADATVSICASMLIVNAIFGHVVFDEVIGYKTTIKIVLMLIAVGLVYFSTGEKKKSKQGGKLAMFWVIIQTASGVGATVVTRMFAREPMITDNNSLYFTTNLIMLIFAIVILCYYFAKDFKSAKLIIGEFKLKSTLVIGASTLCSNISSVCAVLILAVLDISVYTPVNSAVGILSSAAASVLLKERFNVQSIMAVFVSIAAVII